MKDKDKEAYAIYENTILQREGYLYIAKEAWQAACEYKQKEIDDLIGQLKSCVFVYEEKMNRLIAENAELREALKNCPILGEVHRDSNDRFKEWNLEYKYILKELE